MTRQARVRSRVSNIDDVDDDDGGGKDDDVVCGANTHTYTPSITVLCLILYTHTNTHTVLVCLWRETIDRSDTTTDNDDDPHSSFSSFWRQRLLRTASSALSSSLSSTDESGVFGRRYLASFRKLAGAVYWCWCCLLMVVTVVLMVGVHQWRSSHRFPGSSKLKRHASAEFRTCRSVRDKYYKTDSL